MPIGTLTSRIGEKNQMKTFFKARLTNEEITI